MLLLRILGMWLLLAAAVVLVYDATLTLGAGGSFVSTSLGDLWRMLSPGSLKGTREALLSVAPDFVWSSVIAFALARSAWLVFAVLGVIVYWQGRRRRRVDIFAN
ncbi:MAG: hypothetical protein GC150_10510 [Rhizobiales bacterium]|nr:hypothetical protein [Hyphomicrobiales bacterium]